jgi:hypothetical protein
MRSRRGTAGRMRRLVGSSSQEEAGAHVSEAVKSQGMSQNYGNISRQVEKLFKSNKRRHFLNNHLLRIVLSVPSMILFYLFPITVNTN